MIGLRNAVRVKITFDLLKDLLRLDGDILFVGEVEPRQFLELIVASPDLPEIPEGARVPEGTLLVTTDEGKVVKTVPTTY